MNSLVLKKEDNLSLKRHPMNANYYIELMISLSKNHNSFIRISDSIANLL